MKPLYSHSFPISTPSLVFPNYTQVHQTFVSRCPTSVYNLLYQNLIKVGRVIQKFSLSRDRKSSLLTQFLLEEHLGYPLSFPIMSYFFLFNLTLLPLYEWFLPNQSKFSGVSFFFFCNFLIFLAVSYIYLIQIHQQKKCIIFFPLAYAQNRKTKHTCTCYLQKNTYLILTSLTEETSPHICQHKKLKKEENKYCFFQCQSFRCLNSCTTLRFAFVI